MSENTHFDELILDRLLESMQEMTEELNRKGTSKFKETEKVEEVSEKMIELIGEMQFYKILPESVTVCRMKLMKEK